MNNNKIDLIRQALGAADSSIKLARQLLSELESGGSDAKQKAKELPGISGVFDGENMVSETGEIFPVPANYASKSLLVVGDTLKLVEEGKEKRFKQIEHVKRHKTLGILAKKDGKWKVVTPEGSYKVLPVAVAHFGAEVGSEVVLHLPSGNLTVPYGAIESVKVQKASSEEAAKVEKTSEEVPAVEKETEKKEKSVVKEETKKPEVKVSTKEVKVEVKKEEAKPVAKQEVKKEAPKPAEAKVEIPKPVEQPKPAPAPAAKAQPVPAAPQPVPANLQVTEEEELA